MEKMNEHVWPRQSLHRAKLQRRVLDQDWPLDLSVWWLVYTGREGAVMRETHYLSSPPAFGDGYLFEGSLDLGDVEGAVRERDGVGEDGGYFEQFVGVGGYEGYRGHFVVGDSGQWWSCG